MSAQNQHTLSLLSTKIIPKTKVKHVQQALIEAIFRGHLRPGDRVLEANLAKELGVSQATVNQALLELHSQGIVSKSLNKETRISCFGLEEIEALFFVRSSLEVLAVEAASMVRTPIVEESLRRWVQQMREAAETKNVPGFYLADYEFHQELYRLSNNKFLTEACQAIAAAPFAYLLTVGMDGFIPLDYVQSAGDHEEIVEAIVKGPQKARQIVRSKLRKWYADDIEFIKKHINGHS